MVEAVRSLFTAAQLARILNVPPTDIRRWVRGGLLQPTKVERRLAFFDFKDVATARAVHVLTRAGVTPRRIKRSLKQLGEWLPDAHSMLTQLEAIEAGGSVRVRLRSGQAADPSGQLLMDFTGDADRVTAAEERILELRPEPQAGPMPDPHSAEAWFDAGVQAEEAGAHEQAVDAYEQALEHGAGSAEVYFNLGNALYAVGRPAAASSRYLSAVEQDPDYVEAWNNLGNALVDAGRAGEAIRAYRQALALEPHYADAHSNLAEAHAQLGQMEQARHHWRAYLREDPHSSWAEQVRRRLLELQRPPEEPDGA